MPRIASTLSRLSAWVARTWARAKTPASLIYLLSNALVLTSGYALASPAGPGPRQDIGNGLVATGIAGIAVFVYVLFQQETASRLKMLGEFGLRRIFQQRGIAIKTEYASRTSTASRRIDIMGFGLNSLREDFRDNFPGWASRCQVRILLLDPDAGTGTGSYADVRDREEDASATGTIRREVEAFLADTTALRASNPRFTVRLYSTIPSVNIFRVDNELFFGPYLLRNPSRNLPTFLVGTGALFDSMLEHFETIWEDPQLSRAAP